MSIVKTKKFVELVCDTCGNVIDDSPTGYFNDAKEAEWWKQYKGNNLDIECRPCRSKRERAYDAWATSPTR